MKQKTIKILSLILCLALLAGCSAGGGSNQPVAVDLSEQQANSDTLLSNEEMSYVLIYNPDLYDEYASYNELLNTGDFASYVEAIIPRADGPAEIPEVVPVAAMGLPEDFDANNFDLGGSRGGAFVTPYSVGDTHAFYCGEERELKTFTCVNTGESCNIWTFNNAISSAEAQTLKSEFDSKIYPAATEMFGESRFASNGGKVNILVYPMDPALGGFFHPYDLFASDEVSPADKDVYRIHTDHDVININSFHINGTYGLSTIAHEFQHLICFTNYFETVNYTNMRVWLNEAMSGYIEEVLYPGAKIEAGHYESFATSNRIRHGQSMYNFDTSMSYSDFDIGVYGSVYLFSEYLANVGGKDIFSGIHSYWRTSYSSTLSEAEAIANSVSSSVYDDIANSFDFSELSFNNEEDEWLSKLTLNFYLSLLKYDSSDPKAYELVEAQTLLYDEINPADIEGGGRVIAALKDGEFKFPEDADEGLIYIGLNKNFEPVTGCVIR